jgi:hypothetical protein
MLDSAFAGNRILCDLLTGLVQAQTGAAYPPQLVSPSASVVASPDADPDPTAPVHVVVTANEVNDLHGTGPLVIRISKGWRNVFAIRARNDWGGVQDFGDWQAQISTKTGARSEFFLNALNVLRGRNVQTILCVPFLPDEFLTSIAIQECFGAKLCVYLMDDQNVASNSIPDGLMREFLERCSLRLITHPELRFAYERKYGLPFHVLPAIVPADLVSAEEPVPPVPGDGRRGALIGSFWDQSWFDRLCAALGDCACEIDWFGNNKSPWLNFSAKNLALAGIKAHGILPEAQLARRLKQYPFVIVPAGTLEVGESNSGVARLSLPGRILFAVASSHTPVLIVGNPRTCGARFVTHFGVGEVVPYDSRLISEAMDRMSRPANQKRMRQRAAHVAPALSDRGVPDWLARSIELGCPADNRFEDLFAGYAAAIDLDDPLA